MSTSNSLAVSWVDGLNNGGSAVNSYTVFYEPVGNVNSNNRLSQTVSAANNNLFNRQISLNNLAHGSDYNIYITASNAFGTSVASNSFICRTQGIAPNAPVNGQCGATSDEHIIVSW